MDQGSRQHDENHVTGRARRCSLMDCAAGSSRLGLDGVVITVGGADGSLEQVALNLQESRRLLEKLAFILRSDKRPPSPRYGTVAWLHRNSVLRAESRVQDDRERVYEDIKRMMPDVASYMHETIDSIQRMLKRRGKTATKSQTVLARVRESFLVIADAVRGDT
jgi:hypothetical protein